MKPDLHNEMPQGATAHDSFWDYVSLQPETLHNVFWAMSDRGIPRSLRTMECFGIHTFCLVNAEGQNPFVRFHWKPVAGKASLVWWDEAQKIFGKEPDFHRRDLWKAIEAGDYPEWELCLQLIPEALVPVEIVGKLTLNRNPDNFFAETKQVAFHPGHIVPRIDFSNDPLLQGRLFSYTDTKSSRIGGPNFHEIPINRPVCPYHNFQRDGLHRQDIDTNPAAYEPNSLNDNWPRETAPPAENGISRDPTLSLYAIGPGALKGRQVALLVSDGVDADDVLAAMQALKAEGVHAKLLASHMGNLLASDGYTLPIDGTIEGNPSITLDGIVVPNGNLDALLLDGAARHYILKAYNHLKPIALGNDARRFKQQLALNDGDREAGISEDATISDKLMQTFLADLREHASGHGSPKRPRCSPNRTAPSAPYTVSTKCAYRFF